MFRLKPGSFVESDQIEKSWAGEKLLIRSLIKSFLESGPRVPQGSILQPLLFLIYINDINTSITSDMSLFTDHTIIYRRVQTAIDTIRVQDDINTLAKWSLGWQMEFHPAKCNVICTIHARKTIISRNKLYGSTLEAVTSTQYLGVKWLVLEPTSTISQKQSRRYTMILSTQPLHGVEHHQDTGLLHLS